MEGVPKIPSTQEVSKVSKAAKVVAVGFSAGMAAMTPIHKVAAMPTDGAPVTTEKQIVRPEDMDAKVLKDEIDQHRAVFEINEDGEIKRIAGDKT